MSDRTRRIKKDRPAAKKSTWRSWVIFFMRLSVALALVFVPMGMAAAWVIYDNLSKDLPDVTGLSKYTAPQTSRILSSDGQVIATMFEENRTMVGLNEISSHLVKALLAVEDSRFYQHRGVDWVGVGRAVFANVLHRGIDQGASTLTMQLARTRFLTNDQTPSRKIREAILASRIERKYSKEKILEFYLNHVYFGSGAYGVSAASSLYFNRRPSELTLAQSALIAGLVQAPSSLTPLVNPKGALKRMKTVLQRMRAVGEIDEAEYKKAVAEGERMRFQQGGPGGPGSDQLLKYPYFTTYVIAELAKRYPEDMLYRGGLRVSTTLDVGLQKICEEEIAAGIDELGPGLNAGNAACVLIENRTGHIKAMVGGSRWSEKNQFNRAWQAVRQPGSSFKPFVYLAAILAGMNAETVVPDSPITLGNWSPKNSDGRFLGEIPLRTGLQMSRNPVSARLIETVGPHEVARLARSLGVAEELEPNMALALGACEVSPLSMASAYATIASGGMRREPLVVTTVVSPENEMLTDNRLTPGRRIVAPEAAGQLIEMMTRVVTRGTGREAYLDDVQVAGKTGTTDDSRDAWFVGFTPDYTLAVWVGNDDHSAMYGVYGGGLPAILWRRIMRRVPVTAAEFAVFAGHQAQRLKLCSESTQLAGSGCKTTYEESFRTDIVPTTPCPLHEGTASPTPTETPTEQEPDSPPPLETETPAPDAIPAPEETPLLETPSPDAVFTPVEEGGPPPATPDAGSWAPQQ